MPQACTFIGAASYFGQVMGELLFRVENASLDENANKQASQRFRDGKGNMRPIGVAKPIKPVKHQPAITHDHESVGVACCQKIIKGSLPLAESKCCQIHSVFRHLIGLFSGGNRRGWQQLADMRKRPSAISRLPPVGERNLTARMGWGAAHQARIFRFAHYHGIHVTV